MNEGKVLGIGGYFVRSGNPAGLEKAGIKASHREAMQGVGTFARVHDCDGNPAEMWEPA